jgi:hypothetical protein
MKCKELPGWITELKDDEVFVFGSNVSGRHGKGAAKQAVRWGAKYGVGNGLCGKTYGIPTVDKHVKNSLPISSIRLYVNEFIEFATKRKDLEFFVTEIGCGLANYKAKDIAPLFSKCIDLENVYLPKKFINILSGKYYE